MTGDRHKQLGSQREVTPKQRGYWSSRRIWKAYLRGGLASPQFDYVVDDHYRRKCSSCSY